VNTHLHTHTKLANTVETATTTINSESGRSRKVAVNLECCYRTFVVLIEVLIVFKIVILNSKCLAPKVLCNLECLVRKDGRNFLNLVRGSLDLVSQFAN